MVQPFWKAVYYKAKQIFTMWSDIILRYLLKWVENLYPYENLHTHVYNSFIHNLQKLCTTKMSFNRWMDKAPMEHLYNGISFNDERKWAIKL